MKTVFCEIYHRVKPLAVLSVCLGGSILIGCKGQKSGTQTEAEIHAQEIVGKWQADEINNGVICVVTFHADKRLSQYFRAPEGRDKVRPGSWEIKEDTLFVTDQTGTTALIIEEIQDSTLALRSLDSFAVRFHRPRVDSIGVQP